MTEAEEKAKEHADYHIGKPQKWPKNQFPFINEHDRSKRDYLAGWKAATERAAKIASSYCPACNNGTMVMNSVAHLITKAIQEDSLTPTESGEIKKVSHEPTS